MSQASIAASTLYVVATPIGNLDDLSPRAVSVLSHVTRILAEDTREAKPLLTHLSIEKPLIACHDHNERTQITRLLAYLSAGESLALISDRGTPLISDPGYPLVVACHEAGFDVRPIPGACAVVAALSVAGLPTDRFGFEGFLPSKAGQRENRLMQLQNESRTLVFYEAPHRIHAMLSSIKICFGDERLVVIARELTKRFETIKRGTIVELLSYLEASPLHQKGEFVVCVAPALAITPDAQSALVDIDALLKQLLAKHSVKEAAAIASTLTGLKKNALYTRALSLD